MSSCLTCYSLLVLSARFILPFSAQMLGLLKAQSRTSPFSLWTLSYAQSGRGEHDLAYTSPLSSDQNTSLPSQPLPQAFQKPSKLNLFQCMAPPSIHIHSQKKSRHHPGTSAGHMVIIPHVCFSPFPFEPAPAAPAHLTMLST